VDFDEGGIALSGGRIRPLALGGRLGDRRQGVDRRPAQRRMLGGSRRRTGQRLERDVDRRQPLALLPLESHRQAHDQEIGQGALNQERDQYRLEPGVHLVQGRASRVGRDRHKITVPGIRMK
jgi:hypothetical protein